MSLYVSGWDQGGGGWARSRWWWRRQPLWCRNKALFSSSYMLSELHHQRQPFTKGSVLSYKAGVAGGDNPAKRGESKHSQSMLSGDTTLVQSGQPLNLSQHSPPGTRSGGKARITSPASSLLGKLLPSANDLTSPLRPILIEGGDLEPRWTSGIEMGYMEKKMKRVAVEVGEGKKTTRLPALTSFYGPCRGSEVGEGKGKEVQVVQHKYQPGPRKSVSSAALNLRSADGRGWAGCHHEIPIFFLFFSSFLSFFSSFLPSFPFFLFAF